MTYAQRYQQSTVFWDRSELDKILSVYGRMVAAGEWRDYAMDALPDRALFSIYARASEAPLYLVEKRPALAQRQGAYAIVAAGGLILRRGADLPLVLRFFGKKRFRAVE